MLARFDPMGVELDLSELAVLRPIQTAASTGGAAATATRGNDDDLDAANTGCVTPTAVSSSLPRQVGAGAGAGVDIVVDVADTGCVTPTAVSSLLPRQVGVDIIVDAAVFSTPTSSPCLLRPVTECPPAPRKPARAPPAPTAAKRKRCGCDLVPGLQRSFFPVPQDLSAVFVPRGGAAADRSPPAPAAKKIRRLFVVG